MIWYTMIIASGSSKLRCVSMTWDAMRLDAPLCTFRRRPAPTSNTLRGAVPHFQGEIEAIWSNLKLVQAIWRRFEAIWSWIVIRFPTLTAAKEDHLEHHLLWLFLGQGHVGHIFEDRLVQRRQFATAQRVSLVALEDVHLWQLLQQTSAHIKYYIILYYIILYYIMLYYIILYYITLYYVILYSETSTS